MINDNDLTTAPSHRRDLSTQPAGAGGTGFHLPVSRRQLFAIAGGAAFLGACGTSTSKAKSTGNSTPTTTASTRPLTTVGTATTPGTAPLDTAASTSPGTGGAAATTAVPTGPIQPLTGLPVTGDPAALAHAAIVVKIDNNPLARPQFGINQTDIVFEEIVEIGTRFFTIFHSQIPAEAGPVRSARTQDVNMVTAMDTPLFMWSGGNPGVTTAIHAAPLKDLGAPSQPGLYHRVAGYAAPHDLIGNPQQALAQFGSGTTAPSPIFTYRAVDAAPANAVASGGVDLLMLGFPCEWRWDSAKRVWVRTISGAPHKDHDGVQISVANVIVMTTTYLPSPVDARSPEAQTVGNGAALVFTGGMLVKGTWARTTPTAEWDLRDSTGAVLGLAPGRSWVELAKDGDATVK